MKKIKLAVFLCLSIVASGCHTTRDASRSEIELDIEKLEKTGKLSIKSPKDVELQDISVTRREGQFDLRIGSYRAVVSQAALLAAVEEVRGRNATWARMAGTIEFLADKAAASQGVPQTPRSTAPPAGMKWVIGEDGIPALVPKDDPSVPRAEILDLPFGFQRTPYMPVVPLQSLVVTNILPMGVPQ